MMVNVENESLVVAFAGVVVSVDGRELSRAEQHIRGTSQAEPTN